MRRQAITIGLLATIICSVLILPSSLYATDTIIWEATYPYKYGFFEGVDVIGEDNENRDDQAAALALQRIEAQARLETDFDVPHPGLWWHDLWTNLWKQDLVQHYTSLLICDYIYQIEQKLHDANFRQVDSGFDECPDGSNQPWFLYKKYERGFIVKVRTQYSYALGRPYLSVNVE